LQAGKKRQPKRFAAVLLAMLWGGIMVCGFSPPVARAEIGWYNCRVNLSGPGADQTFINLTDLASPPAFADKWFLLPPARAREMLAVALTAINAGRCVLVQVDPASGRPEPVLLGLYLMTEAVDTLSGPARPARSEKP